MEKKKREIPTFTSRLPIKREFAEKNEDLAESASLKRVRLAPDGASPSPRPAARFIVKDKSALMSMSPKNPRIAQLKKKARRSVHKAQMIKSQKNTGMSSIAKKSIKKPLPIVNDSRRHTVATMAKSNQSKLSRNTLTSRSRLMPKKPIQNRGHAASMRLANPKVARSKNLIPASKETETVVEPDAATEKAGNSIQPPKRPKRKAWDLKGKLQDAQADCVFYKSAIAEQQQELEKYSSIKEEVQQLEDNLSRSNSENEVSKSKIMNLTSVLEKTRKEHADYKENAEYKINNIERIHKDEIAKQKVQIDQMLEYEKVLKKTINEKENEILSLGTQLKHKDEAINKFKITNDEKDADMIRLKRDFNNLQESKDNMFNDLSGKLEERDATIVCKDNIIEKKNEELRNLEEKRRYLLNQVQELKGNIRVYCRTRPMLPNEDKENTGMDHIDHDKDEKSLKIFQNNKTFPFEFDRVFDTKSTQEQIFDDVSQLIQSALDGYNVCIFAYGQTGAGKTYTMEGCEDNLGIIPRAMELIFEKCENNKKFGWTYQLGMEQVQIYMETLLDMLPNENKENEKLEIKTVSSSNKSGDPSKIWVKNLSRHKVENYHDVMRLLRYSRKARKTSATKMNDFSSRSHSVFIMNIKAFNSITGVTLESALNLIDLAGSEKVADTGSQGQQLKEAKKINSSLSSLSNVITSLSNKSQHIPYRNSKLTFLLRDSLGGNSKTLMFININPNKKNVNESINTLRFATTVNNCNIGTARKVIKS